MPLHLRWEDSIKDQWTWFVSAILLTLPLLATVWLQLSTARIEHADNAKSAADAVLSEFDILLDHINGRLINLQLGSKECTAEQRLKMHRAAYVLPGVEAFLLATSAGQLYCSSWQTIHSTQRLTDLDPGIGLHLSLERPIPIIQQKGILVYRWGADGNATLAVLSRAAVQQLLDRAHAPGDTLMIIHTGRETPIATSKLVGSAVLERINAIPISTDTRRHLPLDASTHLYQVFSAVHPHLGVAYLYQPPQLLQILKADYGVFLVVLLFSVTLTLAWIPIRRQWLKQPEHQIAGGLKQNEFEAWFQPIVSLQTGDWVGAEALARWIKGGQPWVSPMDFIPHAEESGQIFAITQRMAQQSCQLAERVSRLNPEFYVSINTSPNYLDESVLEFARRIQHEFPTLTPRNIRVEMTETGLASDRRRQVQRTLEGLSDLGCQLGIDDFGTGHAGLDYLSDLPFHFLKLDRRFVQAIDTDSIDFRLLESIVRLAHSLALTIIAEGVETERQAEWLRQQGVKYAQGWLYSPALPADSFYEAFPGQNAEEY